MRRLLPAVLSLACLTIGVPGASAGTATTITLSEVHGCALTPGGGLVCWGGNYYGQLGDGTTTNRTSPTPVRGLWSGVTAAAAGDFHSCAVTTGGGVMCWGLNDWGQLGDGTTTQRLTPTPVTGLSTGVAAVAAGYSHTCALTTNGGVVCWGKNIEGQLGDGSTVARLTPVQVSGLSSGVMTVVAGQDHTCALTATGGVKCWGTNANGELGDGTTTMRLSPMDVSGLSSGVAAVAAGWGHTCAVTTAGAVKCWGYNSSGQLGDGTTTSRLTPTSVSGLTAGGAAVAGSGSHSCALTTSGGVKCWGENTNGQLGDGTTTNRLTPTNVAGVTTGAAAVSTGLLHSCVLKVGGGVACWGGNTVGQLGDGTTTSRSTQAAVSGLTGGAAPAAPVTAGWGHTCTLTPVGGVKCWGYNGFGQLGDGTITPRSTPVAVSGLAGGVAAVEAGYSHSCALTTGGAVKCWGENSHGELGDGTTTQRLTPTAVSGLASGVVAIAVANYHTCALTTAGGVKCWGYNNYGELGDGTTTGHLTPADVTGLSSGVVALGARLYHTCAVTTAGGVKCWGYNNYGQLGDGTTYNQSTPVAVTGLASGVVSLASGRYHNCALTADRGLKCWGNNSKGQLGDGTTTQRLTPVAVSGSGFVSATVGSEHTCALTVGGGARCWGANAYGQLGDGTATQRLTPTDVSGLPVGAIAVAAGVIHTCAVTAGGAIKCWGYNQYGRLGDGTTTDRWTPTAVTGLSSNATPIASNDRHTCAITSGGGVECWGSNTNGQVGDGSTAERVTPTAVTGLSSGVASVTTGSAHSCALTDAGGVKCWGDNANGQLGDGTVTERLTPTTVAGLGSGVVSVRAGYRHTCALTQAGGVVCWGTNTEGQLGDGSTTSRPTPTAVNGLWSGVVAVTAGGGHSCALTATGGVLCWGDNWYGQLGDGTTIDKPTPTAVSGLGGGVAATTAGSGHSCALTSAGGVLCWGINYQGQLGDGTYTSRSTPTSVSGLSSGVVAIAAGSDHTIAVLAAGDVRAWGLNNRGQLGDGTSTNRLVPVTVIGLVGSQVVAAAGLEHTCTMTAGGSIACWGDNVHGQLGDGTTTVRWTPATLVALPGGMRSAAAGEDHSCALTAAGGVVCWGRNYWGQLGDGTTVDRATPAPVDGLSSGVVALSAGGQHTCALTEAGGLLCWGHNGHGQVGDGSMTDRTTPTAVSGLGNGVAAVAAGSDFTCAVTTAGGVLCWGNNDTGNLGDGTTDDSHTPRAVSGLSSGAVAIEAGERHACAVLAGGGVVCWGENQYGQLGDGSVSMRETPVAVTGLPGSADALAAGRSHTCALTVNGAVLCWGRNDLGQLGDGTSTNRRTPAGVSGLASGVASIAAGEDYTCAVTAMGGVRCWGHNADGQLGDGTTADRFTPTPVTGLFLGVASVSSGRYHACAVKTDGGMSCWGEDSSGQLGLGTRVRSAAPVSVYGFGGSITVSSVAPSHGSGSGGTAVTIGGTYFVQGAMVTIGGMPATDVTVVNPETITAITGAHSAGPADVVVQNPGGAQATLASAFAYDAADAPPLVHSTLSTYKTHVCALSEGGGVVCWGANNFGQLGDGTTTPRLTPTLVSGLWSGVVSVVAGGYHSCALTAAGAVLCWGRNSYGEIGDGTTAARLTPTGVSGLTNGVAAIAAGEAHTCAAKVDGSVVCWGYNADGQLGDNGTTNRLTPVAVSTLPGAAAGVATGKGHTCALMADGTVWCWGMNGLGQLGDGTTTGRLTPVPVTGLSGGVMAVSANYYNTCAIITGGGVRCWGWNDSGQIGDGTMIDRHTPTPVVGLSSGIAAVAVGYYHVCAVTGGGGAACWGANGYGQLGDGMTTGRLVPVGVSGLAAGIMAVAAGENHSCALTIGGRIACWGYNGSGELGDGTTSGHLAPMEVSGTRGTVAQASPIAGGDQHTCMVTPAGGVRCSGANAYGQLGDGTTAPRLTFAAVTGLASGVAGVTAGAYHSCALTIAGSVTCWGGNDFGQLGDATTTGRATPVAVSGLASGVTAVAAGYFHTCALTSAGSVLCWGRNTYGQLGDGTTSDRPTPTGVFGLGGGAVAIATGAYHTCAVTTAGALLCWGQNGYNQLGDGTSTPRWTPTAVRGLSRGVAAVHAAFRHTCALTTAGGVLCWGDNFYGQLGDGSTTQRLTPTAVSGLASGAAALSGGADYNCVLTPAGGVLCWGRNIEGQLGDGTTTSRSIPVAANGLSGGVAAIAAGKAHSCAMTPAGLECWGANDAGQLGDGTTMQRLAPTSPTGQVGTPPPVALGQSHACALTPAGGVECWGSNSYGQLGVGTTIDRSTPTAVSGLASGVAAVVAGGSHTCALTTAGGVKCWGWNTYGQLGDGTATNRSTPVVVYGLSSGVAAVAAGYRHTCALTTSGAALCWGWNAAGQVGDGTTVDRTTPTAVSGFWSGVAAIAAGNAFTCAVNDAGGVACWGYNGFGQLGDGTTTNRTTPTAVSGLIAMAIAAGHFHSCALTAAGGAVCWGSNSDGQVGDATRTDRWTPTAVSGLESGVAAVTAGDYHNCALTSGGGVKCWGYNAEGQLGDGTTSERLTPVATAGLASGVSALAAGGISTCAAAGGTLQCWGDNSRGELGVGSILQRPTPTRTRGLEAGAQALAKGGYHTCATTSGGGVMCWGYNLQGQLGDGTTANRSTPGQVVGLASGIASVKAGTSQTCVLTTGGGILCWGDNEYGGVGDGTTVERLTPAAAVGLDSGVSGFTVGGYHACAVSAAGSLLCWGHNNFGQLGDGTFTDHSTATQVSGLTSGVASAAASDYHTCAVTTGRGVLCWGDNNYGQLGDGTNTDRGTPVSVTGLGSGVASVATGDFHTCALTVGGGVKCWGSNSQGQLGDGTTTQRWTPVTVSGLESGVIAVTAGAYHSCALKAEGGVVCWGHNRLGSLGDGTTAGRLTPAGVSGMQTGVSAVEAAKFSTCVLTAGGIVWCWGDDAYGELGLGTRSFSPTPIAVYGRGGAIATGSIAPSTGASGGGSTVTITGAYFLEGATVTIGGVPASDVLVVNDGTITATTGPHAAGSVDVVVQNPDSIQATLAGAFTYIEPPGTFGKILPANGAMGVLTSTALTWTASAGATSYEYCYDTSNDGACSLWTSAGSSTGASLSGLAQGTTYYWQVRATNSVGTTYANGGAAEFWSFTTLVPPPGAFNKASPANGAANQPTTVTLTWEASSGATLYEVCVDTTNDDACAGWNSTGPTTSVVLMSLARGTSYYWHVRAQNAGGTTYANGSAVAYWSFATVPDPPEAFHKVSPANTVAGQATSLTLSWEPSARTNAYSYCYDTSNDGVCGSTWWDAGLATAALVSNLTPGTTYYWQVRAANLGDVTYADAGLWWSFTTRSLAPSDFDGDGKSDILWRHVGGGDVWLWPMDGAERLAEDYVRTVADTAWEIRGQGDQNGDGRADILWRHKTNGQIYYWPMDGGTPLGETYVATVDPAYDIVGAGDFDGDGKSDMLWRNLTNGEVWIWLMDGATPMHEVYVDRVDTGYTVKGVGNLDDDGKADIVWQGTAGDVWVWPMLGTTRLDQVWVGTVPDTGYQIQGVADFTGDGTADLVWWHATRGEVWLWTMNGAARVSETWVATVPDTEYRIVGAGDYDGDGKADLAWHHVTRGEVWLWLMDGSTRLSETWVATVPDTGYRIIK